MKNYDRTEKYNTSPIFIVGVGRSGSSLLQSMMASHSYLAFPPETSFLRRLVGSGLIETTLKEGRSATIQLLDRDKRINRTGLDGSVLLEQAEKEKIITGGVLYRVLLLLYAKRAGKKRYGDKDPRAIEFLGLLKAVLPDVQVVNVIRDPRDVLASKKKAAWSRKRGSIYHIFSNRVQLRIGQTQGAALLSQNYHELIYEDLIADPERILLELCLKLDLPFEQQMLEFNKSAKKLVSESEMSWKKETLGPLLRDNHSKWKNNLHNWEVALTELVCGGAFKAGGYKKSGLIKQMILGKRMSVYMIAAVIYMLDPIYRQYRRWSLWRARNYV